MTKAELASLKGRGYRGKASPRFGFPGTPIDGRYAVRRGQIEGWVEVRGEIIINCSIGLTAWKGFFLTSLYAWIRKGGGSARHDEGSGVPVTGTDGQ